MPRIELTRAAVERIKKLRHSQRTVYLDGDIRGLSSCRLYSLRMTSLKVKPLIEARRISFGINSESFLWKNLRSPHAIPLSKDFYLVIDRVMERLGSCEFGALAFFLEGGNVGEIS